MDCSNSMCLDTRDLKLEPLYNLSLFTSTSIHNDVFYIEDSIFEFSCVSLIECVKEYHFLRPFLNQRNKTEV